MANSIYSLVSCDVKNLAWASFASVEYYTKESKLNKGDLARIGCVRVEKHTIAKDIQICYNYESATNAHIDAHNVGKDSADFQTQPMNGYHWVNFPLIAESNKEQGKYALRYYLTKKTETITTYYVDGKKATETQLQVIREILASKPKYESKKQSAFGLAENEQVKPLNLNFCNLVELHAFGDVFGGEKERPTDTENIA